MPLLFMPGDCSGKEIRNHSVNETEKGSPENCITVSHASSTSINTASYAVVFECRTGRQHAIATAVQTYNIATGRVYTDNA